MAWTPEQRRAYNREWDENRRDSDPAWAEKERQRKREYARRRFGHQPQAERKAQTLRKREAALRQRVERKRQRAEASYQRLLERNRAWARTHPERVRELRIEYEKKQREITKANRPQTLEHLREVRRLMVAERRKETLGYTKYSKYGLSRKEFASLLLQQGGRCAICQKPFEPPDPNRRPKSQSRRRRPHIDHDHDSGAIRGLLCRACNLACGNVEDDWKIALALSRYLRTHPAESPLNKLPLTA